MRQHKIKLHIFLTSALIFMALIPGSFIASYRPKTWSDPQCHFWSFAIITLVLHYLNHWRLRETLTLTFSLNILSELAQSLSQSRGFSVLDIKENSLGIILTLLLLEIAKFTTQKFKFNQRDKS